MLWLEYLTQTHEIFTQKTGAHVLFEPFFRTIFAFLEAECHRFLISYLAWRYDVAQNGAAVRFRNADSYNGHRVITFSFLYLIKKIKQQRYKEEVILDL